jgi:hypothetical protein
VPGGGKVLRQKLVEIRAAREAQTASQFSQTDLICDFPDLPVLPETLLKFELAVRESAVELAWVSSLILSDPGAAIQVMRLAGSEWSDGSHPGRIEDCISGLCLQACLDAMSKRIITRCTGNPLVVEAWEHARAIADFAGLLAEGEAWRSTPENARWVGLCHEIGRLPMILGWDLPGALSTDPNLAGLAMAKAWSLPRCVVEYFSDRLSSKPNSPWTAIVGEAHQMVEREAEMREYDDPSLDSEYRGKIRAV